MRRSYVIRARCGTVVVEHGRVAAKRRRPATSRNRTADRVPQAPRIGIAAELARMLRDRLAFPEMLFSRDR